MALPKNKFAMRQERLIALAEGYGRRFGGDSYTVDDVADWAIKEGLYPCPDDCCGPQAAYCWELLLQFAIKAKGLAAAATNPEKAA
jgi:hypothetical protein